MAEHSHVCQCGQTANFYQIQSGRHSCEQCTLNEIYTKEESYDDVVKKVMGKMQNIIKVRQKKTAQEAKAPDQQ